jgi:hypothetical protein
MGPPQQLPPLQLVLTWDPMTDQVRVVGPTHARTLCAGILARASMAVITAPDPGQSPQVEEAPRELVDQLSRPTLSQSPKRGVA